MPVEKTGVTQVALEMPDSENGTQDFTLLGISGTTIIPGMIDGKIPTRRVSMVVDRQKNEMKTGFGRRVRTASAGKWEMPISGHSRTGNTSRLLITSTLISISLGFSRLQGKQLPRGAVSKRALFYHRR